MRIPFLKSLIVGGMLAVGAQAHADLLSDSWQDFQRVRQQGSSTVVLDVDNDSLLLQKNDGARWKLGLDLGCLGPCAGGEWVQTNLRRVFGGV